VIAHGDDGSKRHAATSGYATKEKAPASEGGRYKGKRKSGGMKALLQFLNAKNKRVGMFAVWRKDFGGCGADGLSDMPGIVVCAV